MPVCDQLVECRTLTWCKVGVDVAERTAADGMFSLRASKPARRGPFLSPPLRRGGQGGWGRTPRIPWVGFPFPPQLGNERRRYR